MRPTDIASLVLLLIGLGLDVASAFLGAKRLRGEQGPSGVPLIPMGCYFCALAFNPAWWGWTPLMWLFVLHVLMQFAAPVLLSKWTR